MGVDGTLGGLKERVLAWSEEPPNKRAQGERVVREWRRSRAIPDSVVARFGEDCVANFAEGRAFVAAIFRTERLTNLKRRDRAARLHDTHDAVPPGFVGGGTG